MGQLRVIPPERNGLVYAPVPILHVGGRNRRAVVTVAHVEVGLHPIDATDRSQPIPLQRQVQIAAGGMAFTGTLLAAFVHPGFLLIPGFVGAGLMMAGVTGFCGMALLLANAPWNRALRKA